MNFGKKFFKTMALGLGIALFLASCGGGAEDAGKGGSTQTQSKKEASANGSENGNTADGDTNDGKADDEVKGRIDTIHQTVTDFVGKYYNRFGESFEIVEESNGIRFTNILVHTREYGRMTLPDSAVIHDSDISDRGEDYLIYRSSFMDPRFECQLNKDGTVYAYESVSVGEDQTMYYKELGYCSTDPSIVEDIHYYREIRAYGDPWIHKMGYELDSASDENHYFRFLYDTETGFVTDIRYISHNPYAKPDEINYYNKKLQEWKAELLSDTDQCQKYLIKDIIVNGADFEVVFGLEKVGNFEQYVSIYLLDGRQNLEEFIKGVYTDYQMTDDSYKEGKLGDNFVYHMCNGFRVEWYD